MGSLVDRTTGYILEKGNGAVMRANKLYSCFASRSSRNEGQKYDFPLAVILRVSRKGHGRGGNEHTIGRGKALA